MTRKKKPKVRRTVSLTPQHYLLLESLSRRLDQPMTAIVEALVEGKGREMDLHPMSHEAASLEILSRRGDEDRRRRRWTSEDERAYRASNRLMQEAFGC